MQTHQVRYERCSPRFDVPNVYKHFFLRFPRTARYTWRTSTGSVFQKSRMMSCSFKVVGIGLLCASHAFGQATPPPREIVAETERVVVTGSYIPTAETETALPVTVYIQEVLQKQGANTPAEALRKLVPSFVGNT